MNSVNFIDCEKSISEQDIIDIENYLGIKIPLDLSRHYLKYNGGEPEKTIWRDSSGKLDFFEIRDFTPFRHAEQFADDPDFTIEGRAKEEWNTKKLPFGLLPFAIDWGGNYFCVDCADGKVYFYARDSWNESLSSERNFKKNSTFLDESFESFLNRLEKNEEE